MTRKLLMLPLLLIIVNVALAEIPGLDVDLIAIKNKAAPNQNIEYNISFYLRPGSNPKYITIQTTFMCIDCDKDEPAQAIPYNFYIEPGQTVYSYLTLKIPTDALPTTQNEPYQKRIFINSAGDSEEVYIPFWVDIPQEQALRVVSMSAPASIEPRYPIPISMEIDKQTLDVEMIARFVLRKAGRTVEYKDKPFLVRQGTHTYNLNFSVNHLTEPGDYTYTVQVRYLDTVVKERNSTIEMLSYYNPEIYYTSVTSIFGQSVYVNALNNGTENVENLTAVKPLSTMERLLTYYSDEGAQKSEYSISWFAGDLVPGELKVYEYRVTFVPLLLLPFFVGIIAFLIYIWTRKVVVIKEITGHMMEGGIMEVKVQIMVHNISRTPFFNFKIVEHLPPLVSAVAGIKALNGEVIVRGGQKKIKWHIDEIRQDEQVMITYKMKTKIEILGKVMIPPTYILFEKENGKTFERKSNVVELQTVTKTFEEQEDL